MVAVECVEEKLLVLGSQRKMIFSGEGRWGGRCWGISQKSQCCVLIPWFCQTPKSLGNSSKVLASLHLHWRIRGFNFPLRPELRAALLQRNPQPALELGARNALGLQVRLFEGQDSSKEGSRSSLENCATSVKTL